MSTPEFILQFDQYIQVVLLDKKRCGLDLIPANLKHQLGFFNSLVAALNQCPHIICLTIYRHNIESNVCHILGHLKYIEYLNLESNNITHDGLAPLLEIPKLKRLHLTQNALTNIGAQIIFEHPKSSTVHFFLGENGIDEEWLEKIEAKRLAYRNADYLKHMLLGLNVSANPSAPPQPETPSTTNNNRTRQGKTL